jgi:hypothetical protein
MPSFRRLLPPPTPALIFVGLAVPMIALVLYTLRGVGLEPSQLLWAVAATTVLAAASSWVIGRL